MLFGFDVLIRISNWNFTDSTSKNFERFWFSYFYKLFNILKIVYCHFLVLRSLLSCTMDCVFKNCSHNDIHFLYELKLSLHGFRFRERTFYWWRNLLIFNFEYWIRIESHFAREKLLNRMMRESNQKFLLLKFNKHVLNILRIDCFLSWCSILLR